MKQAFRRIAFALLLAAAAAHAGPEGTRCATIAAADARLACYDGCGSITAPEARLSCYDAAAHPRIAGPITPPATTSSAPAPGAAAPGAAAPGAAAPDFDPADPKNFGLSPQRQWTAMGPKSVSARIVEISSDQRGNANVVLDSGQTWAISDDDGQLSRNERVTIKRAALGSFLLWNQSNHSYHVRRVQ